MRCVCHIFHKDGILEVTARGDRDTTSIYAYDAENHIVGKVNVLSYDKVTRKICLVPIGDTKAPDASAVKQGLDEIFKNLMIDFDVTIAEPIAIQYAKGSVFTHGGRAIASSVMFRKSFHCRGQWIMSFPADFRIMHFGMVSLLTAGA